MAQRSLPQPFNPDASPSLKRALERIQFHAGPWYQMQWFVTLAGQDFTALSQGELQAKQEEFQAVAGAGCRLSQVPAPPTLDHLLEVQTVVRTHLEKLVNGEQTVIVQPIVTRGIGFRPGKPIDRLARPAGSTFCFYEVELSLPPPFGPCDLVASLPMFMGQLLKTYASSLRRCPHCHRVFLQFRRSAKYCGRTCQSVGIMKQIRATAKNRTRAAKRAHRKEKP